MTDKLVLNFGAPPAPPLAWALACSTASLTLRAARGTWGVVRHEGFLPTLVGLAFWGGLGYGVLSWTGWLDKDEAPATYAGDGLKDTPPRDRALPPWMSSHDRAGIPPANWSPDPEAIKHLSDTPSTAAGI